MESKKCYFCQAYATSREHVPPKCLFPEKKDILGFDLRRDLITVPSCEIHNTAKSSDDEFLLLNLSGIVGSNTVGEIQRWKKVERARIRRKWNIPDIVLDRTDNIEEVSNDGELQVLASWGPPDLPRLNSCYESIARGIHLHHYGNYFDGEINTHICYLTRQSGNFKPDHERFGHAIERDMKGKTFGLLLPTER